MDKNNNKENTIQFVEYNLVHSRPVKMVHYEDGSATVLKYSYDSGEFEYGMKYLVDVTCGGEEVDHISEEEFIQYVEDLRRKKFAEREDGLYDLYMVVNALEEVAEEQGRSLREDEIALAESIKRQTYKWFESDKPNSREPAE